MRCCLSQLLLVSLRENGRAWCARQCRAFAALAEVVANAAMAIAEAIHVGQRHLCHLQPPGAGPRSCAGYVGAHPWHHMLRQGPGGPIVAYPRHLCLLAMSRRPQ